MNPLTTVKWPLIIGFAVAVIIASLIGGFAFNEMSFARWLHIVSGIFWIGLLYYFNAVQTPAMAAAAADKGGPGGAGVNKYVAPLALLWFRWSALATWLMGAWLLSLTHGRFVDTFTFGLLQNPVQDSNIIMGIGAWLGTIMLFNVWVLIWPNQKKILGIVPATDEQKAAARKVALVSCSAELLGVLLVGTLTIVDTSAFPDQTVWSDYGMGYLFLPVVIPITGLLWLRRSGRQQ